MENINNFNKLISENIKEENANYVYYFGDLKSGKTSITLEYSPLLTYNEEAKSFYENKEFIGLDCNGVVVTRNDVKNYVYGISPAISGELIVNEISKLTFKDKEGLDLFIKENYSKYMFRYDQERFVKSLARYLTLSLTYNYAVCIVFDRNVFEGTNFTLHIDYDYEKKDDMYCFYILGCPSIDLLKFLNNFRYIRDGEKVYESSEGMSIEEMYKDIDLINLYNTKVFYSGMLIRPLHIKKLMHYGLNDNILGYKIYFEKSSYGTVYGFDCLRALDDKLLAEDIELLSEFFEHDDKMSCEYLIKDPSLENINEYLKKTYNVNQIVVSGNIVLKDDTLIFSIRGKKSIDYENNGKDKLYPGSNGNAEIISKDVDFYKNSVEEDLPTIDLNNIRLDFNLELTRETYSELKVISNPLEWDYYGICLSGAKNRYEVDGITYRKMHFNVLAKQKIDMDFKDVCKSQATATESYESKDIVGLKLKGYKNLFDMILNKIKSFIKLIYKSEKTIKAIILFLSFIFAVQNKKETPFEVVSSVASYLLGFITLIIFTMDIVNYYKKKKKYYGKIKTENYYFGEENIKLKLIKYYKKYYKFHPATMTLLCLHIVENINTKENKK